MAGSVAYTTRVHSHHQSFHSFLEISRNSSRFATFNPQSRLDTAELPSDYLLRVADIIIWCYKTRLSSTRSRHHDIERQISNSSLSSRGTHDEDYFDFSLGFFPAPFLSLPRRLRLRLLCDRGFRDVNTEAFLKGVNQKKKAASSPAYDITRPGPRLISDFSARVQANVRRDEMSLRVRFYCRFIVYHYSLCTDDRVCVRFYLNRKSFLFAALVVD